MLQTGGPVRDAAATLGVTAENVRLYCELSGIGTPPATANGVHVSPARADILDPARLRDLYEYQNMPMTEIGAMAGCGTATIRRLLELDGVPQRPSYRGPPPDSGITREWLEREYTVKLRRIETLSRERGVTAPYLMSLAKKACRSATTASSAASATWTCPRRPRPRCAPSPCGKGHCAGWS